MFSVSGVKHATYERTRLVITGSQQGTNTSAIVILLATASGISCRDPLILFDFTYLRLLLLLLF